MYVKYENSFFEIFNFMEIKVVRLKLFFLIITLIPS